jgi:AhpD family alkylhydroperoxidase
VEEPELPSPRRTFPLLEETQHAYLGAIESLPNPDRRTTELIRLACAVVHRNPMGVERHTMLACEFGASWEDVAGTLALTQPSSGLVPAIEALPHARRGFLAGLEAQEADTDDDEADA